ncbi:hypothetical protein HQQ81_11895 [Microbacteriaceae bacterium VKM Ac-2854]|nr:hypothetical protein [Microbacteriaceae bacterium VKM Ac-2854]
MTILQRQNAQTRRAAKAARRAAVSGSGPTPGGSEVGRNPGAIGAFGLFGEVLYLGILVTLAGLAVITLPAALAAATQHLRRYIAAEESGIRLLGRDFVRALPGGLAVGAGGVVVAALLAADIVVAGSGALPGGTVIAAVGWIGLVVLGVALLAAARGWTAVNGWRAALSDVPQQLKNDPVGTLYLAAAVGFVGVLTWMLPPLLIPALGCAALAAVAIPERPRRAL